MIELRNSENDLLSYGIKNLSPIQYEPIHIKNELLDGTFHVQTIGTPLKFLTFEIIASHNQAEAINLAESRGEPLKLIIDDVYYEGMLEERPEWERLTLFYRNKTQKNFQAGVTLVVSGEGVI